jgi:Txe/YoeB family toxin of Txe-Axe toxin-antitoxin module
MGTTTAQMLIGQKHTYDSGIINVSHELRLSENSVPAWSLVKRTYDRQEVMQEDKIVWLPTLERMLEDGLLMVGLYVLKDAELIEMADKYLKKPTDMKGYSIYNDINPEHLELMYQRSRKIDQGHKIVLTVLDSSTVMKQIQVLEKYPMDIEVCVPVFKRELNPWSRQREILIQDTSHLFDAK